MTPYINGTAAICLESLNYDPVSFKRLWINAHTCQMKVRCDRQNNAVFELCCDNTVVMAFLYRDMRPWGLRQRREAFGRLFQPEQTAPNVIPFNVLPTEILETLPEYPYWQLSSPLGEDAFWACEGIRLSARSSGKKKTILSILLLGGLEVASFRIDGLECDDEDALEAALTLRERLHVHQQIRIESRMDHHTIVWYIPSRLSEEVRHG